jgi:mRNA interferase RelE/StbE
MQRTIRYTRTAARQMDALGTTIRLLIENKLDQMATDPTALANQVKQLKGDAVLRLRVGDYRVFFTDDGLILDIVKVGPRGSVYKE